MLWGFLIIPQKHSKQRVHSYLLTFRTPGHKMHWEGTNLRTRESFSPKERQTAMCSASFGCVWSLASLTPYVLLQMDFESLFGGCSKGMQLLIHF